MDFIEIDIQEQQRNSGSNIVPSYVTITANNSSLSAVSNLLSGVAEGKIIKYNGKTLVNSLIAESGDTVTITNISGNTFDIVVDENGNLKFDGNIYATGEISAYGLGTGSTGGGLIQSAYNYDELTGATESTFDNADYTNTINAYAAFKLNEKIDTIEKDKYFKYTQNSPSAVWEITHNLNKYPTVIVTDSAGTTVEGEIKYIDQNNVQITFKSQFSGDVICN